MEVKDEKKPKEKDEKDSKEKKKEDGTDKNEKEKEREKKEVEPSFEILQNPARILRQQLKVLQLVEDSVYKPVKDLQIGGIVMVKHAVADKEEELVEPVAGKLYLPMKSNVARPQLVASFKHCEFFLILAFGPKPDEEKESEAPEPFEFTEE